MSLMPAIRRGLIEPLWARWKGTPILRAAREFEATQHLPQRVLLENQWLRFQKMLRFAYAENDFWRSRFDRHGITPADITVIQVHLKKHFGTDRRTSAASEA